MIGAQELLLVAVAALFILGPERLPEAARFAAQALRRLRTYGVNATRDLRGIADLSDVERDVQELRRELGRTRAELRRALRDTVRPIEDTAAELRRSMTGPAALPDPSVDAPAAPPAGRPDRTSAPDADASTAEHGGVDGDVAEPRASGVSGDAGPADDPDAAGPVDRG